MSLSKQHDIPEKPKGTQLITHQDMSNDEYHSKSEYISSSFVKSVHKHSVGQAKIPLEPSEALLFGDQFHTYMEGEDGFYKRFATIDDDAIVKKILSTPKKDGTYYSAPRMTAVYKNWLKNNTPKDRQVVSKDRLTSIKSMYESIVKNEELLRLLEGVKEKRSEWSFFTKPNHTITFGGSPEVEVVDRNGELFYLDFSIFKDLKFRIRPDYMTIKDNVSFMFDWKTCKNASLKAFKKDFFSLGYDIQAIFYAGVYGLDPKKFFFVAVEKETPFSSAVYGLDEVTIDSGILKLYHALLRIKKWKETGFDGLEESRRTSLL